MRCDWSKVGGHIWMRFDRLLKIGQHFNCQRRNNVVVLVFFLFNLKRLRSNLKSTKFSDVLEIG